MLNKKSGMVALILFIVIVSTVGIVLAATANVGSEGNYSGTANNTYVIKAVDKTNAQNSVELKGFSVDANKEFQVDSDMYEYLAIEPGYFGTENAINSTNLNKIKEVIVRYYRHYNTPAQNLDIQNVIWALASPNSNGVESLSGSAEWLYNSLGVLNVGDAQSIDGGVYTYDFTFYLGTPTNGEVPDQVSQIFLFTYGYTENPNRHTPDGGDQDYVDPTKINPEGDDPGLDDDDFMDESSQHKDSSSNVNHTASAGAETGVPMIAVLVALIAIIGSSIKRE